MSFRRFVFGVGIGLAVGLLYRSKIGDENISPEKVLRMVKQTLSSKMNINGSWIHMIPETLEKNNLEYTVYRGGITTIDNEQTIQYDFVVDAKTGTVLEITK